MHSFCMTEARFYSHHFSTGKTESDNLCVFKIPAVKPNVTVPVIEVILK